MSDEKKVVSASELRAQARHTITNPETGNTFEIREVWARDLYKSATLPAPPIDSPMPGAGNAIDPEQLRLWEVAILVQGVVVPRVIAEGVDDEAIAVSELRKSDRDFLLTKIVEVSGLVPATFLNEAGEEAAGAVGGRAGAKVRRSTK